jgi:hypothetical protein
MTRRSKSEVRQTDIDPVVAAYLADVDLASIRKNLTLTYEERFLQLMELQNFDAELRRAGGKAV